MFNKEEEIKNIKNLVMKNNKTGVIVLLKGDIKSSILVTLAKLAFPNNTLALKISLDTEQWESRNALRIIESIKLEDVRIDLNNNYEEIIKSILETKDIYRDPETYNTYLKTGKAPIDNSYLDEEILPEIKNQIKSDLILTALRTWSIRKNYHIYDNFNEFKKYTNEELINIAKELNIPEIIIKTQK